MDQPIEQDESTALIEQAKAIQKIADANGYHTAVNLRGLFKKAVQFFEKRAKPNLDNLKKALKDAQADLARDVDPIEAEYRRLGGLIVDFDNEQERLKRQREREQQIEEARQRQEAEDEKKRLVALATELGYKKLAKEIKAEPIEAPPPQVILKETPSSKETGVSFREDFKFRIKDEQAIPRTYLMADEVKIGKVVRALKLLANIPGIEVYSVRIPVQRT